MSLGIAPGSIDDTQVAVRTETDREFVIFPLDPKKLPVIKENENDVLHNIDRKREVVATLLNKIRHGNGDAGSLEESEEAREDGTITQSQYRKLQQVGFKLRSEERVRTLAKAMYELRGSIDSLVHCCEVFEEEGSITEAQLLDLARDWKRYNTGKLYPAKNMPTPPHQVGSEAEWSSVRLLES